MGRDVARLVVAGGETAGAVLNAVDIKVVRIGCEIAPGVPWVQTTRSPTLDLALKSGNFGGIRFFLDALECAP
jgi:3-dehydrotetronate 4-kinase